IGKKLVDLAAEILPQMMGQAHLAAMAVALAVTTGGVDLLVNRVNDLGDIDQRTLSAQQVTATGTTHTVDQLALAQARKQLLKVRQRDTLSLRNISQRHRPLGGIDS